MSLLINFRSTYNFINVDIVGQLGLKGVTVEPFEVKVANRDNLKCRKIVRDVKMNVQGVQITTELYILSIGGLDVIIGNAWLKSLKRDNEF